MSKTRSIGSHQSALMKSDVWLTPPDIIQSLGLFDLDPCCPLKMPWRTATQSFSLPLTNGLEEDWFGRVWLNPPYSKEASQWLKKLAAHGNGIALIFARTETKWFHDYVWRKAHGILFIHGRLHFHTEDGIRANSMQVLHHAW